MRIAIDAHTFCAPAVSGGDVYVLNLVREFAALTGDDSFVVLLNAARRGAAEAAQAALAAAARGSIGALAELRFGFAVTRLPGRLPESWFNWLYYGFAAPRVLRREEADVAFGANYYVVTKGPWRKVVKVHDVAPILHPEFTHPKKFKRFERDLRRVVAAADAVITDTHATKADIVAALDVDADKVIPIYEAPEEIFTPGSTDAARAALAERYAAAAPFFLFVGAVQPRKNVAGVIAAFDLWKQRSGAGHELLIVGPAGWRDEPIRRAREQAQARDAIRFLGAVPREDLPLFYRAAEALVWPSFYEGIGLPLLEAMACAAPVITSDRGSMKEAAGDAALLVDPHDPEAIADAMERVASDAALRARLCAAGRARAAEFTWRKTAEETLAVLRGRTP